MKYPTSPPPPSGISRNVSPLPIPNSYRTDSLSASHKSFRFFRRLCKFSHMDFQMALWQMIHLFVAPQKVYKNANYRKRKILINGLIWLINSCSCRYQIAVCQG